MTKQDRKNMKEDLNNFESIWDILWSIEKQSNSDVRPEMLTLQSHIEFLQQRILCTRYLDKPV